MFNYMKKDELNELEWKCITEIKDKLSVTENIYERIKLYHLLIDTRHKIELRDRCASDIHHQFLHTK